MKKNISYLDVSELPKGDLLDLQTVYTLLPRDFSPDFYKERTDRNLGWINSSEQQLLSNTTVGIAGCGGMGGLLAVTLLRLGIGELRIADPEFFDISNLNRQYAATMQTVGVNKAVATAEILRDITSDTKIVVYPQGITEETVDHFMDGCDVVCDEIEFFELGPAFVLHEAAIKYDVPIFGANTCGFGSHIFLFEDKKSSLLDILGITFDQAIDLDEKRKKDNLSDDEHAYLLKILLQVVTPGLTDYAPGTDASLAVVLDRLKNEGRASIIATNPTFSAGFLADRVLLYILGKAGIVKRSIVEMPVAPEYYYIDAALMTISRGTINQNLK